MIYRPTPGERVTMRYRPTLRAHTGLHLARGVVVVAGGGHRGGAMSRARLDAHRHGARGGQPTASPINALVELEGGRQVVVPRGQLFKEEV